MRFDKNKLESLAALPDDELWQRLCDIGRGHGLKMNEKRPAPEEMSKIRRALNGELGFAEALALVNKYRRGT